MRTERCEPFPKCLKMRLGTVPQSHNQPLLDAVIHYAAENRILDLPDSLTVIESEAFADLPDAEAVILPAGIAVIAADAFDKTVILIVPDEQWACWAEENGYQWQMSGSGTPAADR